MFKSYKGQLHLFEDCFYKNCLICEQILGVFFFSSSFPSFLFSLRSNFNVQRHFVLPPTLFLYKYLCANFVLINTSTAVKFRSSFLKRASGSIPLHGTVSTKILTVGLVEGDRKKPVVCMSMCMLVCVRSCLVIM